jgi:hypothetical protein
MNIEYHEKHHLPKQFNEKFHNAIKVFGEERVVNVPIHVQGDGVYKPPREE